MCIYYLQNRSLVFEAGSSVGVPEIVVIGGVDVKGLLIVG